MRLAKEANINALFIQVRKTGDAYYKSAFEARATNIAGDPDFDPLAYIIRAAHAQGIQVHAWMNTFRIWGKTTPPADPNHIAVLHPDWITRTATGDTGAGEGLFLDPGVAEVRDYTFNVFMDVVRNYDIDGIHLDYVRYPGAEFGYAPPAVQHFNLEKGREGTPVNTDPEWMQWRRDQVTALVSKIYKDATALKPNIMVSVAAVPWGDCQNNFCDTLPFRKVYQDWRGWLAQGVIDACIPMNYRDESNPKSAKQYRNWLDGFNQWKYDRQIYTGLDFNRSPEMVVRQIEAARKRGIAGMVGFSFNQTPERTKLVQVLKQKIYSESADFPEMTWKLACIQRQSRDLYRRAIDAVTLENDLDKGLDLLTQAVEIDPKYIDAHFRLGRIYSKKELWADAVKEFDEVLLLSPSYLAARTERDAAAKRLDTGTAN